MWTKSISDENRGLMMNFTSFISIFAPIYFKNVVDCRKIKPECFHSPSWFRSMLRSATFHKADIIIGSNFLSFEIPSVQILSILLSSLWITKSSIILPGKLAHCLFDSHSTVAVLPLWSHVCSVLCQSYARCWVIPPGKIHWPQKSYSLMSITNKWTDNHNIERYKEVKKSALGSLGKGAELS